MRSRAGGGVLVARQVHRGAREGAAHALPAGQGRPSRKQPAQMARRQAQAGADRWPGPRAAQPAAGAAAGRSQVEAVVALQPQQRALPLRPRRRGVGRVGQPLQAKGAEALWPVVLGQQVKSCLYKVSQGQLAG